jgi:catechol 2,3-dioxygenase-like lactoylglutathione lyase family enzyme
VSPQLDVFGIVVNDMARSVTFYRLLGLEFPEGAENESHVEAPLPGDPDGTVIDLYAVPPDS